MDRVKPPFNLVLAKHKRGEVLTQTKDLMITLEFYNPFTT